MVLKSKLNLHRIIIRSTKIRLYVSDNANPVCGGQFIAVNQTRVESIGRERTDVAVRAKIYSNITYPLQGLRRLLRFVWVANVWPVRSSFELE